MTERLTLAAVDLEPTRALTNGNLPLHVELVDPKDMDDWQYKQFIENLHRFADNSGIVQTVGRSYNPERQGRELERPNLWALHGMARAALISTGVDYDESRGGANWHPYVADVAGRQVGEGEILRIDHLTVFREHDDRWGRTELIPLVQQADSVLDK